MPISNRWNRNNWILPLSRGRFFCLLMEFQDTAEKSFGTLTSYEIIATQKISPDEGRISRYENFVTTNALDITPAMWRRITSCKISIHPVDREKATPHAWGSAMLTKSGEASFYIQPHDPRLNRLEVPAVFRPFVRTPVLAAN
jgi:hypothetical protein